MKKMSEIKITIPPLLAGWHLMTRAGVPRWTHVQVKSMCGGDLDCDKVSQALMRIFGGDHKPNNKDLNYHTKGFKDDTFYEEEMEEKYYEEADEEDWWAQDVFYEEEWMEEEEEIPEELESCADQVEEAFVNYLDSRKRMKELALARGFYPVMPIGPQFTGHSKGRKSDGKGKGGKGKGKQNKGKEKANLVASDELLSIDDRILAFENLSMPVQVQMPRTSSPPCQDLPLPTVRDSSHTACRPME